MKLLVGTHNPSKLTFMRSQFRPCDDVECVSPQSLGLRIDIAEDAHDAVGNAVQKALAYHRASGGIPTFAADSGLFFLDLPQDHPDQPGIHVRRMVNDHVMEDDEEMLRWYQAIVRRHGGRLRASWFDAYCVVMDEAHIYTISDDITSLPFPFYLTDQPCPSRKIGWPLDSLSICPYNGKYFAEMCKSERNDAYSINSELAAERNARFHQWLYEVLRISDHKV